MKYLNFPDWLAFDICSEEQVGSHYVHNDVTNRFFDSPNFTAVFFAGISWSYDGAIMQKSWTRNRWMMLKSGVILHYGVG